MRRQALGLVILLGMASAACRSPEEPLFEQRGQPITAYCSALVNGVGTVDVETDYIPHVVQCENGAAPLEALKAQAVAARTYLYYKLNSSGSINDGTSDQVYSCGRTPTALHIQAAQETAGQVLRYSGVTICAFYVAGAIPSASSCVATSSDNDPTNTEHYVTYNWGLSGNNIEQTTLGWVNTGNLYNRGCKSQNGSTCLANHGWTYDNIVKFYYGADIELHQATGSCVNPTECTSGQTETRDCAQCGTETRTCQTSGTWGSWGACTGQGACDPGAVETQACGDCGQQTRECQTDCTWGVWSTCTGLGACDPGAVETQACGDCGQQTRECQTDCTWGAWSTCSSVQPDEPCDTGLEGVCAEGRLTCQSAALSCVAVNTAAPERCDDLDNDCNGEIDEGLPPVLGTPPPILAAEVRVASAPARIQPGESGSVTLWIANRGSAAWSPSALVLQAHGDGQGSPSRLYTESEWLSVDLVGPLDQAVAAGGEAQLAFRVTLPVGLTEPLREVFWLATAEGEPIRCPAPAVTLEIAPDGVIIPSRPDAGPGVEPVFAVRSGCSCQAGPGSGSLAGPGAGPGSGPGPDGLLVSLFSLLLLAFVVRRRGRPKRASRAP
ncbi:MAG: SpoIID/LytB domain-containing protein [Polyangia bacterium]|nr:SpoIID/LytB domain-containing protein [Polyangia bacterium]